MPYQDSLDYYLKFQLIFYDSLLFNSNILCKVPYTEKVKRSGLIQQYKSGLRRICFQYFDYWDNLGSSGEFETASAISALTTTQALHRTK